MEEEGPLKLSHPWLCLGAPAARVGRAGGGEGRGRLTAESPWVGSSGGSGASGVRWMGVQVVGIQNNKHIKKCQRCIDGI